MNIFLSFTKNYALHAAELAYTIRKYTSSDLSFYILTDDSDLHVCREIFNALELANTSYEFYSATCLDEVLSKDHNMCLTKMAYGRIMAFKLLPTVDKILYMDVDMLVMRPGLEQLYALDLADRYAAVCREISIEAYDKTELKNCGVTAYFNSGLILMNLKKIRQDKIDQLCFDMLKNPPEFLTHGGMQDESILNKAFKQNVIFVNPLFNVQSILFGYKIYDDLFKSWGYANQNEAIKHCIVSHMQGAKPWQLKFFTWQVYQLALRKWQLDYWNAVKIEVISRKKNIRKFYDMLELNPTA